MWGEERLQQREHMGLLGGLQAREDKAVNGAPQRTNLREKSAQGDRHGMRDGGMEPRQPQDRKSGQWDPMLRRDETG